MCMSERSPKPTLGFLAPTRANHKSETRRTMHEGTITCPSCGHQFELSDALTGQIREHLRSELQQDIVAREKDLKKKLDAFKELREALEKDRESLDEQVEKKLKLKLTEAEAKAAKKAEGKFADELR